MLYQELIKVTRQKSRENRTEKAEQVKRKESFQLSLSSINYSVYLPSLLIIIASGILQNVFPSIDCVIAIMCIVNIKELALQAVHES